MCFHRQPDFETGLAVRGVARAELRRDGVCAGGRGSGRHRRAGRARDPGFTAPSGGAEHAAALQELARSWRASFNLPVVAVAGSNGKTTAKEMTAAILSRMGLCMATHGNLNNHIGVPVTLMRLESAHRSAVIEMGANRVGDVAELMRIVQPSVGLITNAGAEHLEGFGDLDGVAKGEGETVSCLKPDGTAIINADDAYAGYWREVAGAGRVVTFGVRQSADFAAKNAIQAIERGEFATRFTLVCPLGERRSC